MIIAVAPDHAPIVRVAPAGDEAGRLEVGDGEAALLGQAAFTLDDLSDPVRELLVVRHD